jgi:hypothetical protein
MNPLNPQFVTALSDAGVVISLIFLSILLVVCFGTFVFVGLRGSAMITANAIKQMRQQYTIDMHNLQRHLDGRFDRLDSVLSSLSEDVESVTIALRSKAKPGWLARLLGIESMGD